MTDTQTKQTGAQLIAERRYLETQVYEADGELTPELETMLADVSVRIEDKIEATARFALSQKHSAGVIAEEIARLTERRDAYLNRAKHAQDVRLRALLDTLGTTKCVRPLVTVAIEPTPPSLVVGRNWDQQAIKGLWLAAPEFVRYSPETWVIDKNAIKKAVAAGKVLPEDMTLERSSRVAIR